MTQPNDTYPPKRWECPECKKVHDKPHYAFPDQVDLSKDPKQPGRVKFNREGSTTGCDYNKKEDTPIRSDLTGKTGPDTTPDGLPSPLFCPHCGFLLEAEYILKVTA